jgi:4'-phosphopantetheinyl transferase
MLTYLIQSSTDIPGDPALDWLAASERATSDVLRMSKRRGDWLLGRWTAKLLTQAVIAQERGEARPLHEIVIARADDGAPYLPDYPYSLSISHSGGYAFCALCSKSIVGVDIEHIARRIPTFSGDYFTEAEQDVVAGVPDVQRDAWITAIWSAKEAALKLWRVGLGVDTRALSCIGDSLGGEWSPFFVSVNNQYLSEPSPMIGWWRVWGAFVLTTAASCDHMPKNVRAAAHITSV